ncbi:hypothetical protein CHU92_13320 [Flavobacterium cyanobacteriorum]|uniref:PrcB C-terminal domain-containing protein n=1 Tax=Flavobacterium cyanobacteriorum TaxID=2022802 RepID=A0A255YV53_9FLAO|nr:protease complex subunit PrcB family protein [Flavobacterium cyanobacteriorum]OYQ33117.1 hypothetical protein CHU92_13320 [Flavobacterium cyanobacteriorum]
MRVLLVLTAVAALAGCAVKTNAEAGKGGSPGTPIQMENNFTILKQESYGGMETPQNIIITSQSALDSMYQKLNAGEAQKTDFNKHTVVILFMGQKSTGGFSIGIESVRQNGDTAEVVIKETRPRGAVTMALTQPYCIALIPKTPKVTFLHQDQK